MSVPRGKRNKWSTEFRLTEAGAVVDRNQSGNWEGDEESSAGRQWKVNLLAEVCHQVSRVEQVETRREGGVVTVGREPRPLVSRPKTHGRTKKV